MALLGAAVLAHRGFGVTYAGEREPLELRVLAALALSDGEGAEEDLNSLAAWLACDVSTLRHLTRGLLAQELVERMGLEEERDERIALTEAGGLVVEAWIARAVARSPGWPPDHPGVDDAIGRATLCLTVRRSSGRLKADPGVESVLEICE